MTPSYGSFGRRPVSKVYVPLVALYLAYNRSPRRHLVREMPNENAAELSPEELYVQERLQWITKLFIHADAMVCHPERRAAFERC